MTTLAATTSTVLLRHLMNNLTLDDSPANPNHGGWDSTAVGNTTSANGDDESSSSSSSLMTNSKLFWFVNGFLLLLCNFICLACCYFGDKNFSWLTRMHERRAQADAEYQATLRERQRQREEAVKQQQDSPAARKRKLLQSFTRHNVIMTVREDDLIKEDLPKATDTTTTTTHLDNQNDENNNNNKTDQYYDYDVDIDIDIEANLQQQQETTAVQKQDNDTITMDNGTADTKHDQNDDDDDNDDDDIEANVQEERETTSEQEHQNDTTTVATMNTMNNSDSDEEDDENGHLRLNISGTTTPTTTSYRLVPNCCAICLACYEVGDAVVWSSNPNCAHAFHQECVLDWLVKFEQRETPCPCCRQEFTDLEVKRKERKIKWDPEAGAFSLQAIRLF